jgi:hypothetical protein
VNHALFNRKNEEEVTKRCGMMQNERLNIAIPDCWLIIIDPNLQRKEWGM